MPQTRTCVCTNRAPIEVSACLAALAAQTPDADVLLVASGVGAVAAEALAAEAQRVLPRAELLHEPRSGLSIARNRALEACDDDEVIAFVDDDALVGDGWLAALTAAWDAADERVACIGGPIRPRFAGARPRWLTDTMLPALSMLDYGPHAAQLDVAVRTAYGANMSFRVGPLRSIGGFDPELGHAGERVWFSEDDEAQRALARAGWSIRYEPGPWVWHVVPPARVSRAAMLRRRYRYGAMLGIRNARARGHALRQLASSAAGVPVAIARRDDPRAMERAMRVVENAGVLAAPLVSR